MPEADTGIALLVPDWPAPAQVGALFTLRGGGVSTPPWDALNLGAHVGDQTEAVRANRALLQAEVARRGGGQLLFLNQVHGTEVLSLGGGTCLPQGASADGVSCSRPGTALVMMVAAPTIAPSASMIGDTETATGMSEPSW